MKGLVLNDQGKVLWMELEGGFLRMYASGGGKETRLRLCDIVEVGRAPEMRLQPGFKVSTQLRTRYFVGVSESECDVWIRAIESQMTKDFTGYRFVVMSPGNSRDQEFRESLMKSQFVCEHGCDIRLECFSESVGVLGFHGLFVFVCDGFCIESVKECLSRIFHEVSVSDCVFPVMVVGSEKDLKSHSSCVDYFMKALECMKVECVKCSCDFSSSSDGSSCVKDLFEKSRYLFERDERGSKFLPAFCEGIVSESSSNRADSVPVSVCCSGGDNSEDPVQSSSNSSFLSDLILPPNIDDKGFIKKSRLECGEITVIDLVENPKTGELYTRKKLMGDWESDKKSWLLQVAILSSLIHPCIEKFIGHSFNEEDYRFVMYTEYCPNGDLETQLKCGLKDMSITERFVILIGVSLGMAALHEKAIIHRDLEPQNIRLDEHKYPRICGLDVASEEGSSDQLAGTPRYMAPEVLADWEVTGKCDVYSFSLILWRFESGGERPFKNAQSLWILADQLSRGERPSIPEHTNPKMANLIMKCWDQDPSKRPTFVVIASELLSIAKECDEVDLDQLESFLEWAGGTWLLEEEVAVDVSRLETFEVDSSSFSIEREIGRGGFSQVYLMKNKKTGDVVAGKRVVDLSDNKNRTLFEREVYYLNYVSHPCIVKLIGFSPRNPMELVGCLKSFLLVVHYVKRL